MTVEEHLYDDAGEMAAALADDIVSRITVAASTNGRAALVVSGGTTPGPVFDLLAQADAPWARVAVTVSDERWVEADDPGSNEKLVRDRLLVGEAAEASYVALKTAHADPHDPAAEAEVDRRLQAMARPFEVAVLGMGPDGHTASLFPGAPGLEQALDLNSPALARGIGPVPGAAGAASRMTLTLRALTDARRVVLLFRGEEKLDAYRRATKLGPVAEAPVRAILHQRRAPVALYWAP